MSGCPFVNQSLVVKTHLGLVEQRTVKAKHFFIDGVLHFDESAGLLRKLVRMDDMLPVSEN